MPKCRKLDGKRQYNRLPAQKIRCGKNVLAFKKIGTQRVFETSLLPFVMKWFILYNITSPYIVLGKVGCFEERKNVKTSL